MDDDPYLTLDLESVWRNGVSDEVLDALIHVTKASFDPETIAELAHVRLVKKRLRTSLLEEASAPSEEFCRFFLQRAGLKQVRKGAIDRYYGPLIKTAFDEALVLPAVQKLRNDPDGKSTSLNLHQIGQRIVTSEHELSIVGYIRRRLAYLVREEALFSAIDRIELQGQRRQAGGVLCQRAQGPAVRLHRGRRRLRQIHLPGALRRGRH